MELTEFKKAFLKITADIYNITHEFIKSDKKGKFLINKGWVPFETFDFDFDKFKEMSDEDIDSELIEEFKKNWLQIKKLLQDRLNNLNIPIELKKDYLHALELHEQGSFCAVSRILFPNIEELERRFLTDDDYVTCTSSKEFRRIVKILPAGHILKVPFGLNLVTLLDDCVFSNFKNTEFEFNKYNNTDIPNRHVTMHGLIRYDTMKASLNMLHITLFIYMIYSDIIDVISKTKHK